ncbi:MAG: hypothetical protein PHI37_00585 [Candidatus Gracilibacteria bacterium]|nr:hypothetical protein [Candidatus Gracilibacteria bacterium]
MFTLDSLTSLIDEMKNNSNNSYVELLTFKDGKFYNYSKEVIDLENKAFIGILVKVQYILQDKENNIFYKSDFLDSIANLNKINFYKSLKDKENDFLEIDIKNLDKKYKLNLKTIMFFQSNEEKLYIIESAKTNLELYLDFLKENGLEVSFSFGVKDYKNKGYIYKVLDFIKSEETIEKIDFSKEIESYINK